MRDPRVTHNYLAVSATHREPGLNVEGIVDLGLLVDKSSIITATRQAEPNSDEATGKEEVDYLYKKERQVGGTLSFARLQPQHLAVLAAFALGQCTSAEVAAGVYLHTITPIQGDLDEARSNPTLTGVQRLGRDLLTSLFTSLLVDELTLTAEKNAWPKLTGALKGTGKMQRNLVTITAAGLGNATSVNLEHKVAGSDVAGRLAAVHQVRWRKTGQDYWQPVTVVSASSANPAVVTIRPPVAAADAGAYEVIYVPEETTALLTGSATSAPTYDQTADTSLLADTAQTMIASEHAGRWLVLTDGAATGRYFQIVDNGVADITVAGDLVGAGVDSGDAYVIRQFGWLPMPARVSEPPLYVSNIKAVIGGAWDGTDFLGGRRMAHDRVSITWSFKNGSVVEVTPGAGQNQVATSALRGRREQTVEISRDMKEAVYQVMADGEFTTFGLMLEATGGEIGSTGYNYLAKVIYPMCALTKAEAKVDGERLGETLSLQVLESDDYPSVIVQIQNAWPSYAQA